MQNSNSHPSTFTTSDLRELIAGLRQRGLMLIITTRGRYSLAMADSRRKIIERQPLETILDWLDQRPWLHGVLVVRHD